MVRGLPKPCQHLEINVGCRFLARNIVSSDDDRKQAAPVPTERDRQQLRDIADVIVVAIASVWLRASAPRKVIDAPEQRILGGSRRSSTRDFSTTYVDSSGVATSRA
jgi:hypothetical protein